MHIFGLRKRARGGLIAGGIGISVESGAGLGSGSRLGTDPRSKMLGESTYAQMHVPGCMSRWRCGVGSGGLGKGRVWIPEAWCRSQRNGSQTDGSDPRRMDSDPRRMDSDPRRMVQIPDGWIQIPDGWIQIPPGFRSCSCHVTHREAVHVGSTEHPPLIRIDIPQSHLRE